MVRKLKGDQYFTSSKQVECIDKRTGELELLSQKVEKVSGYFYVPAVIRDTMIRSRTLDIKKLEQEHRWDKIHNKLTIANNQFQKVCLQKSIERYYAAVNSPIEQAPNVFMNLRGVDDTSHMKGGVKCGKLRLIHIPLTRQEMNFRNILFEQKWSIK
eukprot:56313-Ditylum_brightwellii.AAC.1